MSFVVPSSQSDGQIALSRVNSFASNEIGAACGYHGHSPDHTTDRAAGLSGQQLLPTEIHPSVLHGEAVNEPGVCEHEAQLSPDIAPTKRKRSRKGLGKRFECTADGCGKSYSRAEHLYRHQLNHNLRQIFYCEYNNCSRSFVRADLLKRHMDRHAARGRYLGRRESMASPQGPAVSVSGHTRADSNNAEAAFASTHKPLAIQKPSPNQPTGSPCTPTSITTPARITTPAWRCSGTSTAAADGYTCDTVFDQHQSHGPSQDTLLAQPELGVYAPFTQRETGQAALMSHSSVAFESRKQTSSLAVPRAPYSLDQTVSREADQSYVDDVPISYADAIHGPSTDMVALNQMVPPETGPPFDNDISINKTFYTSIPEDFMAYLFNSPSEVSQPTGPSTLATTSSDCAFQSHQFTNSYSVNHQNTPPRALPTETQQVMAVNNLLHQNTPESSLSEEKSEELFDFIKARFHAKDKSSSERLRASIMTGNRGECDHVLSQRMMQAYICSYWYHFGDQLPIMHKPTFSSDKTPNLLLLAMMMLGAACLDRTHVSQTTRADASVSDFFALNLRWEIFMDADFRSPAKLWVFQALILLELYEKMYSTRELHERAHIHHAAMITLMRRGRSLTGKSNIDSPSHAWDTKNELKNHSVAGASQATEDKWNRWIADEATRRAVFAAFIVDTTHATMFGHSGVMGVHEMRLVLPCDETLWRAENSVEASRIESKLASQGVRPTSFLEGLKATLSHREVRTTPFGRAILMAGLLSVTYHMQQRELQALVLGGAVSKAWRLTLTNAYDSWKTDFDKAIEESETLSDPNRRDIARHESQIALANHTVLHHLAHMAMHVDILDCQIFARAKQLLGRTISPQELGGAQRRIKGVWVRTAPARDATYHALKLLSSVLLGAGADKTLHTGGQNLGRPYEARHDVLMNRSWVLYYAALIVWCYGFALEGPCQDMRHAMTPHEPQREMRDYLLRFGSITDANELRSMQGINDNTALLMVLKESFEKTRWDLLHEAACLLWNCIILNLGGTVS